MKILALGPQDVYPPIDGGKEGIYGALCALARLCDVTYAFPAASETADVAGYTEAGIQALPVDWMPAESLGLVLSATARMRPFKFEKYSTAAAVQAYAARLRGRAFDAIVCFHAHTWRLAQQLREVLRIDAPVLVREHNIEYELVQNYRRSLRGPAKLAALPFELLTKREEQRIWLRADRVAFLSDRDYSLAVDSGVKGRFILAREGVPIPPRRNVDYPGANARLLILLNPRAAQSVANLRDFLRDFWTQASADGRTSGVSLAVTGVDSAELAKLVDLTSEQLRSIRAEGIGFARELAPVLAASLALVSPTFVGGGIRKKVLEAMAHYLPTIATKLDVETCSYFEPGKNILEMGDVEQLCSHVQRLRTDPAFWVRLAQEGRSTIETNASWAQFAEKMAGEIAVLANSRK